MSLTVRALTVYYTRVEGSFGYWLLFGSDAFRTTARLRSGGGGKETLYYIVSACFFPYPPPPPLPLPAVFRYRGEKSILFPQKRFRLYILLRLTYIRLRDTRSATTQSSVCCKLWANSTIYYIMYTEKREKKTNLQRREMFVVFFFLSILRERHTATHDNYYARANIFPAQFFGFRFSDFRDGHVENVSVIVAKQWSTAGHD